MAWVVAWWELGGEGEFEGDVGGVGEGLGVAWVVATGGQWGLGVSRRRHQDFYADTA